METTPTNPSSSAESFVETIDCTLRDGEQAPGVWFTLEEKLKIARLLSDAGVDMLDAGFPAAGEVEVEGMQAMRDLQLDCRLAATARPVQRDIEAAHRARAHEVFLFMPSREERLKQTLNLEPDEAAAVFVRGAEEIASRNMEICLVLEDATRSRPEYMIELIEQVIRKVPVRMAIVADSVGASYPKQFETLMAKMISAFGGDLVFCPHCHNDFGMATANTVAGVDAGARAVTCTVNGLGERAGNADLIETVAALTHILKLDHHVRPQHLPALSEAVEELSGMYVGAAKPVTGFNVYRHESGIHVDSMMKDVRSYEFLPPDWIGRRHDFVLGKHSGRSLVRHLLSERDLPTDNGLVDEVLEKLKVTAAQRPKDQYGKQFGTIRRIREQNLAGMPASWVYQAASDLVASPK